jgi:hypothetical protein
MLVEYQKGFAVCFGVCFSGKDDSEKNVDEASSAPEYPKQERHQKGKTQEVNYVTRLSKTYSRPGAFSKVNPVKPVNIGLYTDLWAMALGVISVTVTGRECVFLFRRLLKRPLKHS